MLVDKVRRFINEKDMLLPGDRVIAAVSGGADSVCLLSVLCALAPDLSVSLRVLHVHHGLRGTEADRDEEFVRKLCEGLGVPFRGIRCDVRGYARAHGLSMEEAGRLARYQALEEEAAMWDRETTVVEAGEKAEKATGAEPGISWRPARIALAHHRDVHVDTIIHHLLRGSGLGGVGGMRPVQGIRIRPLLCVGREEIREYLQSRGLSWCEDSTNASDEYTRNRIRQRLLPMMEEMVNTRAAEHIFQVGERIADADRYLECQAGKVWDEAGRKEKKTAMIRLDAFRGQEEIIRMYLIRRMLDETAPGWKDITGRHFADVAVLAFRSVGSRLDLPSGLTARVGYETLELSAADGEVRDTAEISRWKGLPMWNTRVFLMEKGAEIPKNQCTKWFDYAKIKGALSLRFREPGDYLTLSGGKHKLLTRYMIDEKIPRQLRTQIPVLAEGSHVLWVLGYRISEYYKITADTKTVMEVTVKLSEAEPEAKAER
ncbi:MAG: tRNA lysidine(34) synthetase TilS [Clostridiales bacterium]|nr:tRNA lysidine(34) synthetase TilS [Clostridiales bacterium]